MLLLVPTVFLFTDISLDLLITSFLKKVYSVPSRAYSHSNTQKEIEDRITLKYMVYRCLTTGQLLWEETGEPGKNTDLPYVTVKLCHIRLY